MARITVAVLLAAAPLYAFAAVSATIAGVSTTVVGVGTTVSFTVLQTGFTNPGYSLVDSFPGGANSSNINGSGVVVWTPNRDDIGSHTLTITVSDATGSSTTAAVSYTVVAPVVSITALSPSAAVMYGTPVSFTLTSAGFTIAAYNVGDSFARSSIGYNNLYGDKFYWTPLLQDAGKHHLTVIATDIPGHVASTSIDLTVEGPPAPPVASSTAPVPQSQTPQSQLQGQVQSPVPAQKSATGTPGYVFKTFLTVGSNGAAVTALQQKLTALGLYSGPVTGYFGNLTASAVKNFQKSAGLDQLGYVGPGTRAALNK